jgi:hypothetical protein
MAKNWTLVTGEGSKCGADTHRLVDEVSRVSSPSNTNTLPLCPRKQGRHHFPLLGFVPYLPPPQANKWRHSIPPSRRVENTLNISVSVHLFSHFRGHCTIKPARMTDTHPWLGGVATSQNRHLVDVHAITGKRLI